MENKRYNLRGGASNNCDTEVGAKETVSNDDTTLETSFKKPNLANITIAQLMPQLVMAGNVNKEPTGSTIENCETNTPVKKAVSRKDNLANAVSCPSPVAGGNLKARPTPLFDVMPRSPPKSTSTMSSTDMSLKLKDVCDDISKLMNTTEVTKSILKPSGASVEKLERYEGLSGGRNGAPCAGTVEGEIQMFEAISLARNELARL